MKKFNHRSWNHICWVFESQTGNSRFYLNGEYQGSFQSDGDIVRGGIPGSHELYDSAFIIGQEPDPPSPNGGYQQEQNFVGDITELNLWDKRLSDETIELMGKCKLFERGNVIKWNLEDFTVNKVKVDKLERLDDLCETPVNLFVFSEKLSWIEAWNLCTVHGGALHTPDSQQENDELSKVLQPFKDKCGEPDSGRLAWIGVQSRNFTWYKMKNQFGTASSEQHFTAWGGNANAYYYASYKCAYFKDDGTWTTDSTCRKTACTVCEVVGNNTTHLIEFKNRNFKVHQCFF